MSNPTKEDLQTIVDSLTAANEGATPSFIDLVRKNVSQWTDEMVIDFLREHNIRKQRMN